MDWLHRILDRLNDWADANDPDAGEHPCMLCGRPADSDLCDSCSTPAGVAVADAQPAYARRR